MADERNVTVAVPGATAVATARAADVSLRTHFSVTHALSAARLARDAVALEAGAVMPDPAMDLIRANATGATMVSVAFLEATINEFFTDLVEGKAPETWKSVLPQAQCALAARLWESAELEKLPVLLKVDAALDLFAAAPFTRGTQPHQDAKLVIAVRNALVHARPVTHSSREEDSTAEAVKLSAQLRGKFPPNRFMGNNAAFPDGFLGGGGAVWAFTACLAFTDEFFRKLSLEPRYEVFRGHLRVRDTDADTR